MGVNAVHDDFIKRSLKRRLSEGGRLPDLVLEGSRRGRLELVERLGCIGRLVVRCQIRTFFGRGLREWRKVGCWARRGEWRCAQETNDRGVSVVQLGHCIEQVGNAARPISDGGGRHVRRADATLLVWAHIAWLRVTWLTCGRC